MKKKIISCFVILVLLLIIDRVSVKTPAVQAANNSFPATTSEHIATPIGITAEFPLEVTEYIGGDTLAELHTIEITVLEVMRGSKAWDMVKAADATNKVPDIGYEYLLARVKFFHGSGGGSLSIRLMRQSFEAYSSEREAYAAPNITLPESVSFGTVLQPDQTHEGWIPFIVKQNDSRPLMLYYKSFSWFQLY